MKSNKILLLGAFVLFFAQCKSGNRYEPNNNGKTISDYNSMIEDAEKGGKSEKPLWKLYEERGQLQRPGGGYTPGQETDELFKKALADFDQAIVLLGDSNTTELVNLLTSRGSVHTALYMSQGGDDHRQGAISDFNRAIELNPRNAQLLNIRASLYLNILGQPENAEADTVAALHITYSETYAAWQIIAMYEQLIKLYTILQQRAGTTPAAARYGVLLQAAQEGLKRGNKMKVAEMQAV